MVKLSHEFFEKQETKTKRTIGSVPTSKKRSYATDKLQVVQDVDVSPKESSGSEIIKNNKPTMKSIPVVKDNQPQEVTPEVSEPRISAPVTSSVDRLREKLNQLNKTTQPEPEFVVSEPVDPSVEDVSDVSVEEDVVESTVMDEKLFVHDEEPIVDVYDDDDDEPIVDESLIDDTIAYEPIGGQSQPIDLGMVDDKSPFSRVSKVASNWNWKTVAALSVGLLLLMGGMVYGVTSMGSAPKETTIQSGSSKAKSSEKKETSSSAEEKLSQPEALEKKLKNIAEKTGIKEYVVKVTDVGGGYLLGTTTYYPLDDDKKYTDYTLTAPETKSDIVADETSAKIETELKSSLPTINESIKVKDGDKVSMETYKTGDTYTTILLYDKTPFAYVTSDSELNMVNHVTTYYVSDIAA